MEDTLNRIAEALERIAIAMENAELREINTFRKLKATESKEKTIIARQAIKNAKMSAISEKKLKK